MGKKRLLRCFSMNKKGLSTLVITVIIVLMALVALGIVWAVISGVLQSSEEEVDFSQSKIRLDLKTVYINEPSISIKVNRLTGPGEMEGVRFIFSDGHDSESIENMTSMEELEEKTFYMALKSLSSSNLQTVSIAPLIVLSSGNIRIGNVLDTYKISSYNYNLSSGDSDLCVRDADCPGYEMGSEECNLTTGDISRLWTIYGCVSGRCEGTDIFRPSERCDNDCYVSNATCILPAECTQASSCGVDGMEGLPFCDSITNNLYQNYITHFCTNGLCVNGISQVNVQDCGDLGCTQGETGGECNLNLACTIDSDCGVDGLMQDSNYCQGNEVFGAWKDNFCLDGFCSNNLTQLPLENGNCSALEGNWSCNDGECIEYIECTDDSHCNPEGTCGRMCVDEHCLVETPLLSGIVNSIWPFDMAEYFDSTNLPRDEFYLNDFVKFTSGAEGRCLKIKEYVFPTPPGVNSYIRFDVKSTGAVSGDNFEIWKTKFNCECES